MPGSKQNKEDVIERLRRVQGQVKGLERMVAQDTYCVDVLTQVSATTAALQSCALALLEEHLNCCVSDAISRGGDEAREKVSEASRAIARLVRS